MTAAREQPLLPLVQSYFVEHLRRVRGASPHTVRAYAHALRLFFIFVADRARSGVADLTLDHVRAEYVLAFLDHLETGRRNGVASRNCRLAALRGFVEHLLRHDITRAAEYGRILAISAKKSRLGPATYLEPEQARAILARIDHRTRRGARDRALLLFLYNTGARVGEALAVRQADLRLVRPFHVRLHGKGNKDRLCPLWPETARALEGLCGLRDGQDRLFCNARGVPLTRDGVAYLIDKYVAAAARQIPTLARLRVTPHVFRHSCAVALLQSGIDITVIRDYLGHASIATTSRYISTNIDMKREVLQQFWKTAGLQQHHANWRPTSKLLAFLSSL
jgi:site-specific recombinase XerD